MRIFVKARPGARRQEVERLDADHFIVSVKEPPERGLANRAIVHALAGHLGIPQARIRMVSGYSSRQKVFFVE